MASAKKTLKTVETVDTDEELLGSDSGANGDAQPRHKNFGSALRVADMEPLTFDLCDRTFHCVPAMTSRRLLGYVRRADGSSGAEAGDAIYAFMEAAIMPDQREEWNALLDDEEYVIDIGLIGNVVTWLVENYSGRPTLRSSPS